LHTEPLGNLGEGWFLSRTEEEFSHNPSLQRGRTVIAIEKNNKKLNTADP